MEERPLANCSSEVKHKNNLDMWLEELPWYFCLLLGCKPISTHQKVAYALLQ